MKLLKAITKSLGIKNIRIAIYAWLFNILFSIIIYFTFYKAISFAVSKSIILNKLSSDGFFTCMVEIFRNYKGMLPTLIPICFFVIIAFSIISIFIAGGIYSVLLNKEKNNFLNLISSSVENFFKMLKMFFINLVNFVVVFLLCLIFGFLTWKIQNNSSNEFLIEILFYVWVFISIIISIFSIAIYDFSRIFRLKYDKNFLSSMKKGIKFVFSNKIYILLMFISYILTVIFVHILLSVILHQIESLSVLFITIIAYQIFILFKYYLKIVIMRTETNFIE
jgi:hypothetical protein